VAAPTASFTVQTVPTRPAAAVDRLRRPRQQRGRRVRQLGQRPLRRQQRNHAGINLAGSVCSVVRADTLPAQLDSGSIFHAWVDYNGVTDSLEVRLALNDTRPAAALMSYTVDLVSVLGTTNAFVGFTSGTGAATADHDIRRWVFNSEFARWSTRPIRAAAACRNPAPWP
jgi:hypothetical protein